MFIKRFFKVIDGVLVEESITYFLPNVVNAHLKTDQELREYGIYALTKPSPSSSDVMVVPTQPVLRDGVLEGGWEEVPIPSIEPEQEGEQG